MSTYDQNMSAASARQVFPDRLRGIALLGIVVVNAPPLGISIDGFTSDSLTNALDKVAVFVVIALAQGKFYLLFSFLFGYSAAFILRSGANSDRRRFARRLVGLAAIGLIHAVFFYVGDILLTYAVLGFGLLTVSRRSDLVLRRVAMVALVIGIALPLLMLGPFAEFDPNALTAPTDPTLNALDTALATGSFLDAAIARLHVLPIWLSALFVQQGALAFSAFCLGLLAARHRLLADPGERRDMWRRLAIIGCAVGLPLQAIGGLMAMTGLGTSESIPIVAEFGTVLVFSTAPILAAGYLGLLGWGLAARPQVASFAATPGRASLSVYIGESVLLSLLFCGYGLGFFGQWGAFPVVMAGVAAWVLLTVLAHAWLTRYRQGPLESLLGRVTGQRAIQPPTQV